MSDHIRYPSQQSKEREEIESKSKPGMNHLSYSCQSEGSGSGCVSFNVENSCIRKSNGIQCLSQCKSNDAIKKYLNTTTLCIQSTISIMLIQTDRT